MLGILSKIVLSLKFLKHFVWHIEACLEYIYIHRTEPSKIYKIQTWRQHEMIWSPRFRNPWGKNNYLVGWASVKTRVVVLSPFCAQHDSCLTGPVEMMGLEGHLASPPGGIWQPPPKKTLADRLPLFQSWKQFVPTTFSTWPPGFSDLPLALFKILVKSWW